MHPRPRPRARPQPTCHGTPDPIREGHKRRLGRCPGTPRRHTLGKGSRRRLRQTHIHETIFVPPSRTATLRCARFTHQESAPKNPGLENFGDLPGSGENHPLDQKSSIGLVEPPNLLGAEELGKLPESGPSRVSLPRG